MNQEKIRNIIEAALMVSDKPLNMSRILSLFGRDEENIDLMGAVPEDNSWQARQLGYDSRHFTIDWDNKMATCPQDRTSCSWSLAKTRSQRPVVKIKFRRKDCGACSTIDLCTHNRERRRTLTVLAPQAHFEAQQDARAPGLWGLGFL